MLSISVGYLIILDSVPLKILDRLAQWPVQRPLLRASPPAVNWRMTCCRRRYFASCPRQTESTKSSELLSLRLLLLPGAVYAAQPARIVAAVASAWLLVALAQAIRGFNYDTRYVEGVNAEFLRQRLALAPDVIMWHAVVVLELAWTVRAASLARS